MLPDTARDTVGGGGNEAGNLLAGQVASGEGEVWHDAALGVTTSS